MVTTLSPPGVATKEVESGREGGGVYHLLSTKPVIKVLLEACSSRQLIQPAEGGMEDSRRRIWRRYQNTDLDEGFFVKEHYVQPIPHESPCGK
jgi:hypothetical protein